METAATAPAFPGDLTEATLVSAGERILRVEDARGSTKQPYLIQMRDGSPFIFAGLWGAWDSIECVKVRSSRGDQLWQASRRTEDPRGWEKRCLGG